MDLRGEIVESQKARCDLLKWKLGLVAGLGAAGLGLGSNYSTDRQFHYILCLIPLVCTYVDLLAKHMTLRIMVIGCYENSIEQTPYERFAAKARKMPFPSNDDLEKDLHKVNMFLRLWIKRINIYGVKKYRMKCRKLAAYELEDWALQWSTMILSFLIFCYGLYLSWGDYKFITHLPCLTNMDIFKMIPFEVLPFILVGLFGLFLSFKVEAEYRLRLMAIQEIAIKQ